MSWIQIEWKSGFILVSFSHFYIVWGMGIETKSRVMNPYWMEKWFHSRFLIPLLYSTTYSSGEWGLKPKVVSWIQIEWKSGFILVSLPRFYIVPIAVGNGDWNQKSCHESRLNGKVVSFSLPFPTSIFVTSVGNGDWNQKSCHESRLNGKVVSFSFLSSECRNTVHSAFILLIFTWTHN